MVCKHGNGSSSTSHWVFRRRCQDLTLWYGGTGTLATWSFGTTDAPCIVPQAGESWRVDHGGSGDWMTLRCHDLWLMQNLRREIQVFFHSTLGPSRTVDHRTLVSNVGSMRITNSSMPAVVSLFPEGFDHETFVREMWRTTFHDMSWQPPVRKVPRE